MNRFLRSSPLLAFYPAQPHHLSPTHAPTEEPSDSAAGAMMHGTVTQAQVPNIHISP